MTWFQGAPEMVGDLNDEQVERLRKDPRLLMPIVVPDDTSTLDPTSAGT